MKSHLIHHYSFVYFHLLTIFAYILTCLRFQAMLRFKSSLLQKIETIANTPFFLFGAREQKQFVSAQLFSHFEDNAVGHRINLITSEKRLSSHINYHFHYLIFSWSDILLVSTTAMYFSHDETLCILRFSTPVNR